MLSLLEEVTIDFPSHFILSLIDVYKDTAIRDNLIFPSAITWILRHFSVSYYESTHSFPTRRSSDLSLLERLIIDFPFHFILSFIDVYRDTTTRDKFIFPLAIMWILLHFSVSYPDSTHFSPMCAIDVATVRRSEAQLRLNQPRIETATPPAYSAPSSLAGGVTLEVVMAQLQRMDARLDTLSDELCQVNTGVGRIA